LQCSDAINFVRFFWTTLYIYYNFVLRVHKQYVRKMLVYT